MDHLTCVILKYLYRCTFLLTLDNHVDATWAGLESPQQRAPHEQGSTEIFRAE